MKRPTTCANIISKFEVFECNFQVLSNFLSNFRNIASLRFWTPFASFSQLFAKHSFASVSIIEISTPLQTIEC